MRSLILFLLLSVSLSAQPSVVSLIDEGDGYYSVEVYVNNKLIDCILDPGIYDMILSEQDYAYVTGKRYEGEEQVDIEAVKFGDILLKNIKARVFTDSEVSVIGQSILIRLKSYKIDNTTMTITLEPMSREGRCVMGDCLTGYGRMVYESGDEYVGNFVKGYFDGHGTYFWPNKSFYVGNFVKGVRHGKGVFFYKAHSIQGVWLNGMCEGEFVRVHPDGTAITTYFENDKEILNPKCH